MKSVFIFGQESTNSTKEKVTFFDQALFRIPGKVLFYQKALESIDALKKVRCVSTRPIIYQALKYNFQTIDHIELDIKVIEASEKYLKQVHHGALNDSRINQTIGDAYQYIKQAPDSSYDIIILAFPDPLLKV